ncbi:hypothetical protein [Granulicella sibirica]|uniref:hypothetical protein n=1 Tax=Granulicella sibirica TaxID=2479048 RepID=UPI0013757134|nr:hypothetical protein [Granulicella sibirica]
MKIDAKTLIAASHEYATIRTGQDPTYNPTTGKRAERRAPERRTNGDEECDK